MDTQNSLLPDRGGLINSQHKNTIMFSQAKAIYFDICFACMKVWWKFQHQYINLDIIVSRASDYLNCQCEPFGLHCIQSQESKAAVCLLLKFSQQDGRREK